MLLLCWIGWVSAVNGADWPQWRGPTRDGVVPGFSTPDVWPESLDRLWAVKVGEGYSSPVVADGLVYQLSRQGEQEHVCCLRLESGKTVWHASYPASGAVHRAAASHGICPKSTPVVARGKLYTLGIGSIFSCFEAKSHKEAGHLFCLDASTGETLWQGKGRFAKNAAILVVGDLVAVLTSDGRLLFARPTQTGLEQLAEYPVEPDDRTWAHPVLLGKRILVKGPEDLTCWSLP